MSVLGNKRLLNYTLIQFNEKIKSAEIPAFRAAIIEKTGRNFDVFHNHTDSGNSIYRYPLIQYKIYKGFAALLCIGDGSKEIYHFFQNSNWEIRIHQRIVQLSVRHLDLNFLALKQNESIQAYQVKNWLPLNKNNLKEYLGLSEEGRIALLERVLIGNILAMAKGLNTYFERQIHVQIRKILMVRTVYVKQVKFVSVDVVFETDVDLPLAIGLGKNVSKAFGTVYKLKKP